MRGKRRGPGKYMLITLLILWIVGIICSGEPGPGDGDIIRYPFPHPDLTIYTEEQPPFNYLNEQGQVSGQATLIVREIMRRLDIDCPIVIGGWSSGYNTVIQTGNTALFSTIMTHEREPVFRWVGPIGELQYSVYVRSDNPVTVSSYAALRDRGKIAVVRNDAREEYLRGLGLSSILPLNDDADCIRALSSGEAEFWFGTRDITAQIGRAHV